MAEPAANVSDSVHPEFVEETGPWPFVTHRVYRLADQSTRIWSSRYHRKDLQLYQAANAGEIFFNEVPPKRRRAFFGWQPRELGWLGCALQFVGTVLFNFNTFDAMIPSLNWFQQDLLIWVLNILGSVLFLASGYLAFIETCHAHWAWRTNSITWWVVFANLLGCVGFMHLGCLCVFTPNGTQRREPPVGHFVGIIGKDSPRSGLAAWHHKLVGGAITLETSILIL